MAEQLGALAGWTWDETESGVTVKLQLVRSLEGYRQRDFDTVIVSLNDRQLRSLTRDLTRAASRRGLQLHARPGWWGRVRRAVTRRFRRR